MKKILSFITIGIISGFLIPSNSPAEETVKTGVGSMKISGLFQFWYVNDNAENADDTFLIRRTQLQVSGSINAKFKYLIMVDPAKELKENPDYSVDQKSRMLQDVILTYVVDKNNSVNLGQFKVPLSIEGLSSNANLDLAERALFMSVGNYGGNRDIGIMAAGTYPTYEYQIGFFNGEGQNTSDANDGKDVGARLVWKPIPGLHLGMSVYNGSKGDTEVTQDREGLETKYEWQQYAIKGEYMKGTDGNIDKKGWYLLASYKLNQKWQGVVRYEKWDPDTSVDNSKDEKDLTLGINYFMDSNHAKLQLNYIKRDIAQGDNSNKIIGALQIAL
jgi:phosphate-selective porin